jgi:hypothetical protein
VGLREAVVDPVGEEYAKVEGRELHAHIYFRQARLLYSSMEREGTSLQRPRLAFGLNSAWNTGTVELINPIPTPETIRATIMCARV